MRKTNKGFFNVEKIWRNWLFEISRLFDRAICTKESFHELKERG